MKNIKKIRLLEINKKEFLKPKRNSKTDLLLFNLVYSIYFYLSTKIILIFQRKMEKIKY